MRLSRAPAGRSLAARRCTVDAYERLDRTLPLPLLAKDMRMERRMRNTSVLNRSRWRYRALVVRVHTHTHKHIYERLYNALLRLFMFADEKYIDTAAATWHVHHKYIRYDINIFITSWCYNNIYRMIYRECLPPVFSSVMYSDFWNF
jgi:hypothetical protein